MERIALPTVRPLPACSGMMRVVAMQIFPPLKKEGSLSHPLCNMK